MDANKRISELEAENLELKKENEALKDEIQRLDVELSMASRLKYHLMPNSYPAFPDVESIDIFADSLEVKQVGGDYFDFFRIDTDHIGITMADIFDGGTAAALYMVAFKLYMTSQLDMDNSLEEKIENINDLLCWKNDDDLCLSSWIGVYEISTGDILAVNAGHEKAIILDSKGAHERKAEKVSYLLGVMEGMQYESFRLHLDPGDKLIIYTDGIIGSFDKNEEAYGKHRLMRSIENTKGAAAETTIGLLQKDFSVFIGESELTEDATLLCLVRKGGQ